LRTPSQELRIFIGKEAKVKGKEVRVKAQGPRTLHSQKCSYLRGTQQLGWAPHPSSMKYPQVFYTAEL
jgi:hypothetical protein